MRGGMSVPWGGVSVPRGMGVPGGMSVPGGMGVPGGWVSRGWEFQGDGSSWGMGVPRG